MNANEEFRNLHVHRDDYAIIADGARCTDLFLIRLTNKTPMQTFAARMQHAVHNEGTQSMKAVHSVQLKVFCCARAREFSI